MGLPPKSISSKLNIKSYIIKGIKYMDSWTYILPELNNKIASFYNKTKSTTKSNFSKENIDNILKEHDNGITGKMLSEKWKCNINTIFKIINLEGIYGEIYNVK